MSIIPSMAEDTININISSGKSSGDDVDWWPMFRHDPQHSGYSTSDAPDTNDVLWSYTTGSDVESSPAVVDGRVYIGSDDEKLYCLDANTGDYIWSYKTDGKVFSSPAIADGKVYFGSVLTSKNKGIYCLDAISGDYIWSYQVTFGVYSSPAIVDGRVYIGSNVCEVYCFDANTGDYIWSYFTKQTVWSSPAVADGKVYFGQLHDINSVHCLDADTGDYIWSWTTSDDVWSSPAVANGKVYIGSNDCAVYCLDANTGDNIWNYPAGREVESSPAVADGKVYIGSDNGNFYCLNADTGAKIWSDDMGPFGVYSSPAIADGKIYFGVDSMYCLDANTGDYIWSYYTGGYVRSSPAIADGKVYFGSDDGNIYAFGELNPDSPSNPEISGPVKGVPDVLYNFTFKSESPVGNDLFYWIEWADGSNSGWLGPYGSGVNITESHIWDAKGKYPVQARAKDTNGSVSSWSILQLNIPRNRATVYSLFQMLFDRFPLLEVFLRNMNLLR